MRLSPPPPPHFKIGRAVPVSITFFSTKNVSANYNVSANRISTNFSTDHVSTDNLSINKVSTNVGINKVNINKVSVSIINVSTNNVRAGNKFTNPVKRSVEFTKSILMVWVHLKCSVIRKQPVEDGRCFKKDLTAL